MNNKTFRIWSRWKRPFPADGRDVGKGRGEWGHVLVCRNLPKDSDRETADLFEIGDGYPKHIVTLHE